MPKTKKFEIPKDEQLQLSGIDVASIVDEVVSSLDKLQQAFHGVQDHKYGAALAALLSVVQDIFVNQVAPHLKGNEGQSKPGDNQDGDKSQSDDKPADDGADDSKFPSQDDDLDTDQPDLPDLNPHQ